MVANKQVSINSPNELLDRLADQIALKVMARLIAQVGQLSQSARI